jgi:hypothetical protein
MLRLPAGGLFAIARICRTRLGADFTQGGWLSRLIIDLAWPGNGARLHLFGLLS